MKTKDFLSFLSSLSLSLSLILFIPIQISSQTNTVTLHNKTFFKEDSKWFTTDEVTNEKFEMNTRSMTVKLKNETDQSKFKKLCKKHNVIIENVNILGYYDIILPENSKFYEMFTKYEESNLFSSVEIISHAKLLYDPGFSDQYYLENSNGYPDINIQGAWNISRGSPSVIIAVIDEGVDNDNTDIDNNIWSNYGWDYIDNDSNPDPVYSEEHHATAVAGIIAAETDNGLGIAGIAGECRIMSLRVMGYSENDYNSYVDKADKVDDAIIFAANHGAKVINMSFALEIFKSDFQSAKPSIDAAIEYAYKTKGCLLVAATGNPPKKTGEEDDIYYPARHPSVLAVGGIDKTGYVYGRYGVDLEMTAPATHIYSLLNTSSSTPSDYWGLYASGTSFSTAQVSGVAALIFSKYPNWINYDVRKILKRSALPLTDTLKFGDGLLQADAALVQASPTYQANNNQPQNVLLSGAYGSNPIITWDELPGNDIDEYNIYRAEIISGTYKHFQIVASVVSTSNNTNSWTDNSVIRMIPKFAPSTHFYRVTSIDFAGSESVTSNEVSTGSNWASKKAIENKQEIIYKYNLEDNYPNPFNPSTKIQYSLKEKGFVSLKIYDVLGRIVKILVNKQQSEGNYEVVFDASNLSSGIYYYRIQAGNFRSVKKMLLLK